MSQQNATTSDQIEAEEITPPVLKLPTEHFSAIDLFPREYAEAAENAQTVYQTAEYQYVDAYISNEMKKVANHRQELYRQRDETKARRESEARAYRNSRRKSRESIGKVIGGIIGVWGGVMAVSALGPVGIAVWIVAVIVAVRLGGAVGRGFDNSYEKRIQEADQKLATRIDQLQQEADQLDPTCAALRNEINHLSNERVQAGREEKEKSIAEYKDAFNAAAKEHSLRYANSPLVERICQWLTEQCATLVEHAERGRAVTHIETDFCFLVFSHGLIAAAYDERPKIIQQLNEYEIHAFNVFQQLKMPPNSPVSYEFEKNRCPKLASALDIVCVARAIAARLEAMLIERFPYDPLATDMTANIRFKMESSSSLYSCQALAYSAINPNFEKEASW